MYLGVGTCETGRQHMAQMVESRPSCYRGSNIFNGGTRFVVVAASGGGGVDREGFGKSNDPCIRFYDVAKRRN
jgi:hypothetical protein